jgi:hypothetical protein
MSKKITLTDEAYARLEAAVWDAATDVAYLPEWFGHCVAREDSLHICIKNPAYIPDDAEHHARYIWKNLNKLQLVEVYLNMPDRTHRGGADIITDPDACSTDRLLQQAMFGEQIYG